MTAVIFSGPTLPPIGRGRSDEIVWRSPAGEGDIFKCAELRPTIIGIIDGVFESGLSIWHKEILWALSTGIQVAGAASMGALRAAELHSFGMIGIGPIFEAYRDGALFDDDEVAVVHGPRETDYRPVSDALVNIRVSLAEAVRQNVIGRKVSEELQAIAKSMFFKQRYYSTLLEAAHRKGLPADALDRLRAWLPTGAIDQKRADAEALIRYVRETLRRGLNPTVPAFELNRTSHFLKARKRSLSARGNAPDELKSA